MTDLFTDELAAHTVATGAADGSFAVLFYAWPSFPQTGGAYVEKRAANGTLTWRKHLEFTPTNSYSALAMDAAGNVYVAANAAPVSGLTLDATDIANVRANEATTEVGECVLLRLAAADGAKGWHGHVTLRTGLSIAGEANVQCRGLAVRDNQLVASGVFPTRDIYYVQNGVSTSATSSQSDSTGDESQSFLISVAADTGVKNTVSTLVNNGSGEFAVDGTAIATDGRALLHGFAQGTGIKLGTTGTGELLYTPSAAGQRDVRYNPIAFFDLRARRSPADSRPRRHKPRRIRSRRSRRWCRYRTAPVCSVCRCSPTAPPRSVRRTPALRLRW